MTENKGDLISREALKKAIINNFDNLQAYFPKDFIEEIDNAPTVEEVSVIEFKEPLPLVKAQKIVKALSKRSQGEWIPMNPDCRGYSDYFKCSICGAYIYPRNAEKELDYNGCPYCFADMKKGGAE